MKETVILSAARTPVGAYLGALKDVPAPRLAAAAIKESLKRSNTDARSLQWDVPVPANGEAQLTFTVETGW